MVTIPFELIQAIQAGDCVLWAGAGFGALAGRPGWSRMLARLVKQCPPGARQQLRDLLEQGRLQTVLRYLHRHLGDDVTLVLEGVGENKPLANSGASLLTALPWRACFATTCAELIQTIYAEAGREVEVLSHVDVHRPSLRDHERMFVLRTPPTGRAMRADAALFDVVEEVARTRTILFLGFDVDDPDFAQILTLLDRVGRGRRHYAWLAHVTRPEVEELLETHNIEVVSPSDDGDVARALYALQRCLWGVPSGESRAEVDLVALDLARALRSVPLRADLAADAALAVTVEELELLLSHLPPADLAAVELGALLRLGNVMLARHRHLEARRYFSEVLRRGSGREYQTIARFNLALVDHAEGDALAAVDGLTSCAQEDRTAALVPPRFEIAELLAHDRALVRLGCVDRESGEEVEIGVSALSRTVGGLEQERFYRQVQRAVAVDHPAVQRIRGAYTDGRLFGVMAEPLSGFVLADILAQEGRLELERACEILEPVLDGLAACHARGVVHRLVDPRQILITVRGPVLRSPGFLPCASHRRASVRAGARGYLAPEILAGGEPTAASDVFAAAAVLYHAVTGRVVTSSMQPPTSYAPDLDPRIDQLLAHALHAEPSMRLSPRRLRVELSRIRTMPLLLVSRLDIAVDRDAASPLRDRGYAEAPTMPSA
ncbi:MAG: protein kinase [Nannocystaceae bacterium]|nr:protein kinase [Myxococcales bacterium]